MLRITEDIVEYAVKNKFRDPVAFAKETFRGKPITFESFDFNFYEEFVEYMMYEHTQRRRKEVIKGFRVSTIGKTIKQLRIFLRNRMRMSIYSKEDREKKNSRTRTSCRMPMLIFFVLVILNGRIILLKSN